MNHPTLRSGVVLAVFFLLPAAVWPQQEKKPNPITTEMAVQAQKMMGLNFDAAKLDSTLNNLADQLESYEKLRSVKLPNGIPPAILFNPIPAGFQFEKTQKPLKMSTPGKVLMPKNIEDIAFCSIGQLSSLIRTRKVTSEQLIVMYLDRLRKYGP